MFGKGFNLFRIWGFQVRADASWLLLALLITWSLAAGVFPYAYKGLDRQTYWLMGVLGAAGIFFSIIFHELSHSLVARRYELDIKSITLFVFGGVAQMEKEPPTPAAEFWMAIAGPIASVLIGMFMALAALGGQSLGWPIWLVGPLSYLGTINFILAIFNLIPAFPLDGGRVLRSALWQWKRNLNYATRISSSIGAGFGVVLIVFGVLNFIGGSFIAGMWWFLIGMFLKNAAQQSYQQLLIRRALEGEPISRFMSSDVRTVPPDASLIEFVENYVYRYHHKMFPVLGNGHVQGCVSTQRLKNVPRDEWATRTVGEILDPCSEENVTAPDADAMNTLMKMNRSGTSRLMVVDHGRLEGIISLKDLMKFLSLKLDIEEGEKTNFAGL